MLGAMVWWEVVRPDGGRVVAFVSEFAAAVWARGLGVAWEVWRKVLRVWAAAGVTVVHLWVAAVQGS